MIMCWHILSITHFQSLYDNYNSFWGGGVEKKFIKKSMGILHKYILQNQFYTFPHILIHDWRYLTS